MLTPQESTHFRRDLRRMKKRSKDLEKLKTVVELLVQEQILPERYRDHNLVGDLLDTIKMLANSDFNRS
ncbi:MAG: type II toxin-antitoxin system mRNA interferase toxin, RelE/StbE family [Microcystis wesenbergii TW10]|jgi:mRNA interferase YafQ|uniref:Type II toxin-antitoxin system mRNA interferase toxin, RelE/StbE family n=3 Tax=Microcystis TaxID=1125 RepID=A0A552A939_MICAE|nr:MULTISPECIES: type II toxin-antitoxin system mRNA interferase toxin, RelE/StbE family [Microcystis]MCZ8056832.1 type II toxin-antitoxin system mRNA interferase toxin, RelE/StbE family [Microcystis sp. LE19-12.2C]REJ56027.1 MAG: type II toxin-antitoxin system mRNA interferase toxin, RelE/StbE family [Microcystis wesenbergii TW10]TRT81971.1 MAG: type II toxin-antitoxin system mRNA interferase toxin, RelE/StbE family [Microcystis aeruginosa Ma_OC_H_19870700_S124]MBD2117447.1 type II toxin-antit